MSAPFHRTPEGLNNQALFTHVDAIVFAEGGSQYLTIAEIEEGAGDTFTLDCAFWSTVIRLGFPGRRIEVRSVGNKQTLKAIAQLVANGSLNRIAVAMDRDFDDRRCCQIAHANVFYTRGYSWENDVFTQDVLIEFMQSLAPPLPFLTQAYEAIRSASAEMERCFAEVVRLDHALAVKGANLTDRDELLRTVQLSEKSAPRVDVSRIKAELKRCRSTGPVRRVGPKACAKVGIDLHGHTLARWWLGHVQHLLRSLNGLKMNNQLISRMAIASFARLQPSANLKYYCDIAAAAIL